ncbi:MAG: hypothetical protein M1605_00080 [Candidatus Thermoplasmatota archaeon]|nr:hypothetical protein [Candidatus Thermoplasmatota archaeon]
MELYEPASTILMAISINLGKQKIPIIPNIKVCFLEHCILPNRKRALGSKTGLCMCYILVSPACAGSSAANLSLYFIGMLMVLSHMGFHFFLGFEGCPTVTL